MTVAFTVIVAVWFALPAQVVSVARSVIEKSAVGAPGPAVTLRVAAFPAGVKVTPVTGVTTLHVIGNGVDTGVTAKATEDANASTVQDTGPVTANGAPGSATVIDTGTDASAEVTDESLTTRVPEYVVDACPGPAAARTGVPEMVTLPGAASEVGETVIPGGAPKRLIVV